VSGLPSTPIGGSPIQALAQRRVGIRAGHDRDIARAENTATGPMKRHLRQIEPAFALDEAHWCGAGAQPFRGPLRKADQRRKQLQPGGREPIFEHSLCFARTGRAATNQPRPVSSGVWKGYSGRYRVRARNRQNDACREKPRATPSASRVRPAARLSQLDCRAARPLDGRRRCTDRCRTRAAGAAHCNGSRSGRPSTELDWRPKVDRSAS